MKGAFGHTANREPLIRRILRKPALPTLLLAPVIAASLFAPSAAFAAEDPASPQADTVPQGVLVLCDDPFSVDGGASNSAASVPVGEITFDSASTSANVPQSQDAIAMIADPEPSYKEPVADEPDCSAPSAQETVTPASSVTTTPNTGSSASVISSAATVSPANAAPGVAAATAAPSAKGLFSRSLANAQAVTATSTSSKPTLNAAADSSSGSVEFYEPHEATLVFTAGDGGYVAAGVGNIPDADLKKEISEYYPNSLKGASTGATAFAMDGYHFLYWIDSSNKKVLSKSPSYTPYRPDGGWPSKWTVEAVFARDVYDIVLDPNGGSGGGGGGDSGVVRIEGVALGSNYKLPSNGGSTIAFEKAGSLFTGWDVVAFPTLKGVTGSYHLKDGQVLDSATENDLIKNGNLVLDWASGRTPTLRIYAQWLAGQISIDYVASNNGAVSYGASSSGETKQSVTEIFDAKSGKHVETNVYGPQGATAKPNAHYHFDSWRVSGSTLSMTEEETKAARLDSRTVERLSKPDADSDYQSMSFTATFSPNTYVFNYNANGGSGSIGSQSLVYGSSFGTATSGFEREGYVLNGWNTSPYGTGTQVALGSAVNANTLDALFAAGQLADRDNATATLYAQWKYLGGSTDPDPEPNPDPTPTPQPTPSPSPNPNPSNISDQVSDAINDYVNPGQWIVPDRSADVSDVVGTVEDVAKDALKTIGKETPGLLASSKSGALAEGVLVARTDSAGASASGSGESSSFLDQLMSPEGMQQAGTTVAAVAAVGALMGLVGIGASVAGAAVIGAATIGAAGAVGLTAGVDLAADLAAVGAGAGAGAAAKRRREEEEDADDESEEEDEE